MDVVKFAVVLSDLPLFIRAGHIVPIRWTDNAMSAVESRQQPLTLVVALAATSTTQCLAEGKLMPNANITFSFCADLEKVSLILFVRKEKSHSHSTNNST
jgi:alpha-glucosidase (family GH31 glycosyl hydrolase)